MQTSLYEKVFIDGFQKASYVVATLALAEPPSRRELEGPLERCLERHPRLRSFARFALGVPVALNVRPPREWFDRGGLQLHARADLHALEERLLTDHVELRDSMPLEIHLVADPPALVLKVHHAFIDATSGFGLLQDFARAIEGAAPARRDPPRPLAWADVKDWAARVQLRPRIPEISVTTSYMPAEDLDREPVVFEERVLAGSFAAISERAKQGGSTFSEVLASAVFSAMHQYNLDRGDAPAELGLMLARARPRSKQRDASYTSDTCVVTVPSAKLARLHHPDTLATLRAIARDRRHNDLALALLYASRKLKRRDTAPSLQQGLHFTLSDLTAFGRMVAKPSGQVAIRDLRVLASPTSFDHAGMLVSRLGDDVRLALISHRGALDSNALLDRTIERLHAPGAGQA